MRPPINLCCFRRWSLKESATLVHFRIMVALIYINPMHAPHVVLTMLYFKDPNARPIFFILCWSWCIVRRRLVVVASLSSRMYYVIWWAQYWQKCMCAETNELHPALHATPYACMWWWTNRKTRQQPCTCTCTCTLTADCWFFMHMVSKKCILRPRWLARRRRLWIFRSIPIDYIVHHSAIFNC